MNKMEVLIEDIHTRHLAEQVMEVFGLASIHEAVDTSLMEKLATKQPKIDPDAKMKKLFAELTEIQGPDYRPLSDEEIKELCDEISGGL